MSGPRIFRREEPNARGNFLRGTPFKGTAKATVSGQDEIFVSYMFNTPQSMEF